VAHTCCLLGAALRKTPDVVNKICMAERLTDRCLPLNFCAFFFSIAACILSHNAAR
jgi:hypothetical protein